MKWFSDVAIIHHFTLALSRCLLVCCIFTDNLFQSCHAEDIKPKPVAVSVIITVYNTAEFLPKCLNSVVGQTLQNIEIIDCVIKECVTEFNHVNE